MKLVICVQLAYLSVCLTREMSVVREWTSLDVQLPPDDGQESRRSILPLDVRSWLLYKDRMFVTLYRRWEYSLAYLDLTDNSTSALLRPYPSYEDQEIIYFPDIVRVDRCDRLWVLSFNETKQIIVIDLKTDSILRNITFPDFRFSNDMTVDDFDCDNEYVYIADHKAVWTYSWADGDLWHHITHDAIFSMLLAPNSIVYYNVFRGFEAVVYYMSTTRLRDKSNKTIDRELGQSWNLNVRLDKSALDAKSDVLYHFHYYETIHAVPCWTSEQCSLNCQDVNFDPTHELRYIPCYITVDENGYLWAVTISTFRDEKIKLRLSSVAVKSTCMESNDDDINPNDEV